MKFSDYLKEIENYNQKDLITIMKQFNNNDYELVGEYHRPYEPSEVVRINHLLGTKDTPLPIKVKELNNKYMYFKPRNGDIIIDYRMKENKDKKYELHQLTLKAYNNYGL